MLLVDKEKRSVFFDRTTLKAYCKRKFFSISSSDEDKAEWTLMSNHKLWKSFRSDVRDWCLENWVDWEYENPDWFKTVNTLYSIPVDFIPNLDALEKKRESQKRRTSVGVQMRRASVRFPSIYGNAKVKQQNSSKLGSMKMRRVISVAK